MPAIVTDNLKIQNCSNFISSIESSDTSTDSCYYTFIGYPNTNLNWSSWNDNPPNPIDNLNYHNSYKETILGTKKISSSDVIRAIPKITWVTGTRYDMYRHDYSSYNFTPISETTRLYDSNYYVLNSEFRVYICINNGSSYANTKGLPSTIEPNHTDTTEYIDRGDGYVWKYLYTVSPSDYLKFDSTNYIPVPNNWLTSTNSDISTTRNSAVNGAIRAVVVERPGKYLIGTDPESGITCSIRGDGTGGTVLVRFDSSGNVTSAEVTNPGSGYTYGTVDLESVVDLDPSSERAIFTVIIPPKGGHGYDIYKELGAYRCLVYSRFENVVTNPDFIEGNQFSRVGIVKDLTSFNSSSIFTSNTGSGVYGIVLNSVGISIPEDSLIQQPSTGAKGFVVSSQEINNTVTVIKYIQPRDNYTDYYFSSEKGILRTTDPFITNSKDPSITNQDYSSLTTSTSYTFTAFNTDSVTIGESETTYTVADIGNVSEYQGVYLGQTFTNGLSNPDINTKSGDILYVDNRASITRSQDQREDIKVIIEF